MAVSHGKMGPMAIDMDYARARLRRIVQLIEAKEYYAVGGSRRYLATQRRLTWRASRAGMLVVAAAAPLVTLTLSLIHPGYVGFLLLVNGTLFSLALAAWWLWPSADLSSWSWHSRT